MNVSESDRARRGSAGWAGAAVEYVSQPGRAGGGSGGTCRAEILCRRNSGLFTKHQTWTVHQDPDTHRGERHTLIFIDHIDYKNHHIQFEIFVMFLLIKCWSVNADSPYWNVTDCLLYDVTVAREVILIFNKRVGNITYMMLPPLKKTSFLIRHFLAAY